MALRTLSNGKTLGLFSKFHQQIRGLQTFTLPDLSYDYGALEPAISGEIMQIHHQKHHQTYITNYNKALEQLDDAIAKGDASTAVKLQSAIKFNGGGHVNHSIFWKNLAPISAGGGEPPHGSLGWAIDQHFGSMEKLIAKMNAEGAAVQARNLPKNVNVKCSVELASPISTKDAVRHVVVGLAASLVLMSPTKQVLATELPHNNLCQIASTSNNLPTLPIDQSSNTMMMMMQGMTTKNFDPVRYSGRWYEVASLKGGFAGQGQEDCHCTQGVYTIDAATPAIQVDTFCVHGGPDGYITGIRGRVQCLSVEDTEKTETDLERKEMIKEKCYLRFPTLPFIPKEPYDVIDTDYDNFALVSGAKDKSFIQIYSRTPNPGPEFIEKYKLVLADYGYDPTKIKDTPQDCELSDSRLAAMMSMNGMQQALTNQFPDLELKKSVQFDPLTSVFDTLKKLVQLYFK